MNILNQICGSREEEWDEVRGEMQEKEGNMMSYLYMKLLKLAYIAHIFYSSPIWCCIQNKSLDVSSSNCYY